MGFFNRFKRKPTPPTNPNYVQGHIAGTEYHTAEPNTPKVPEPFFTIVRALSPSGGGDGRKSYSISVSSTKVDLTGFVPGNYECACIDGLIMIDKRDKDLQDKDAPVKIRPKKNMSVNQIYFSGKASRALGKSHYVLVRVYEKEITFINCTKDGDIVR